MINTTNENHKNLDIVNSWNLVWFLSLNIVFCLWLILNNFIHTPNDFYREVMNMLCIATTLFSALGFTLKALISRKYLARLLPTYALLQGILWGAMFYMMVKHYNNPSLTLSLLISTLLPATISFYISGTVLLLFSVPISIAMLLSEITAYDKFNFLQLSGSVIIFIVVITARYILLEWYTRTQQSEYAKNLLIKKLTHLAHRDALTGLLNKSSLLTHFEEQAQRLPHSGGNLFMIIMDIDYFKQYNDLYGHIAGDECLLSVAKCISQSLRKTSDTAFRFGGEEFVVLTHCNEMAEAVMIAERIRTNIQKAKIPHRGSQLSPWLSASFGVAQWVKGYSFAVLAEKADKELYKAKQAGRNQVSSAKR